MKKILSILAVVCFVAVNVSLAQTAPKAEAKAKTETVKAESPASTPAATQHSCCKSGAGKSCSKEAMKNCGPNEKAEAGKGTDKAKTEASKKDTKSGTN
jgi:Ni/Co efflux regulator RcnB